MLNYTNQQNNYTTKQGTKMKPGHFRIYKSQAAASFQFIPPKTDEWNRISKNGCIMIEIAPINQKISSEQSKYYQWDKKILFAFGMTDLTEFFSNPNNPPSILHSKPKSTITKKIEFLPGEGKYEGTMRMILHEYDKSNGGHRYTMVPLSMGEYEILKQLFLSVAPKMIGWIC
tara:strand:+ start:398 stop:916 length:519 start_codon:yes stop_codon:yes gene_type:complete